MSQASNPKTKTTLAQALMWDREAFEIETEAANVSDFEFSTHERISTSRLWLHLTGIECGTAFEAVAGMELLTNPDLFIMLNMSARAWVDWFRREAWGAFDLSEATGNEDWACKVLERSRAMCADMGQLASQMPLRLPK